jgi:hypothetical protein
MRVIKKLLVLLLTLVVTLFNPSPIKAEGEFVIDSAVEYKVETNGNTIVTHAVTLENAFSNLYATAYSLILENIEPQNIKAFDQNGSLPFENKKEAKKVNLKVSFNDTVVGKDKQRTFYISYNLGDLAQKTGEVWEISIPRLANEKSFRNYAVKLLIPDVFKNEAYISPEPSLREESDGFKSYLFNKEAVARTGITAGFGDFQVFGFNLIYHLENPLIKKATIEIALPPETSLQKVYYDSIEPRPENINLDEDGNWLATYLLGPRERMDIVAKGEVQIFSAPRQFPEPTTDALNKNLNESEFWQTEAPEIVALAGQLKTPKAIYDYVSTHLKYDYERVKPNVERLGAVQALANPKEAICMEFTDLFIALARAAGIPAREINGFAYSEKPEIQPLSLVADVLHSWPEYWDANKKVWIPVDPTWGSTTNGIDFFNKLDLRHFTFVIHGVSSIKPYAPGSYKLGPNPQKDVFVSFAKLPESRLSKLEIIANVQKFIPFMSQKINFKIVNSGNQTANNVTAEVFFDDQLTAVKELGIIPAFANRSFSLEIPFTFLGSKTPKQVKIQLDGQELTTPTAKNEVIIYNLAVLLLVIFAITVFILHKLGKLKWLKLNFKKHH